MPTKDPNILKTNDLRDASRAIYLAVNEDIAHDISEKLIKAANLIDSLREIIYDQHKNIPY